MQLSPIFKIKCHNILSLAPAYIQFSSFLKDRLGDVYTNFPIKPPSRQDVARLGSRLKAVLLLFQGDYGRKKENVQVAVGSNWDSPGKPWAAFGRLLTQMVQLRNHSRNSELNWFNEESWGGQVFLKLLTDPMLIMQISSANKERFPYFSVICEWEEVGNLKGQGRGSHTICSHFGTQRDSE